MSSGKYRHRIELQKPDNTRNTGGQPTPVWETVDRDVPAEVTAMSGSEAIRGGQVEATVTDMVKTRFRADITPAWRIVYDSRTLNVTRVIDRDGRRREIEIECKEAA